MKKNFCFLVLMIFFQGFLFATAKPDTFKQFPNAYFVESGSATGKGITWALKAGFQHVYSIELNVDLYQLCQRKFRDYPQVKLFQGDSSLLLYDVIKNIDTTITFWLDGHYSGSGTAKGSCNSLILLELEAIKRHHIKNHTILIDDIRDLGTAWFDYVTLDQVIARILEINPSYEISFADGYVPRDILVAKVH